MAMDVISPHFKSAQFTKLVTRQTVEDYVEFVFGLQLLVFSDLSHQTVRPS